MALDYFLSQSMRPAGDPILRFYGWNPYCLSLGQHQKLEDVDFKALQKDKIEIVRRPTGGSAIFHSEELTYSIIISSSLMNHQDFYEKIHVVLNNALQKVGYKTELHRNRDSQNYLKEGRAAFACFNRTAFSEVKLNNKKVIGSAQKIFKNAVLQHGAILLGRKQFEITKYLAGDDQFKMRTSAFLNENSAALNTKNYPKISILELSEAIIKEFCDGGLRYSYFKYPDEREISQAEKFFSLFKIKNINLKV